jgi:Flp pilus assembly protein TadB
LQKRLQFNLAHMETQMPTLLSSAAQAGVIAALSAALVAAVWLGWVRRRARQQERVLRGEVSEALAALEAAAIAGELPRASFGGVLQETLDPLCAQLPDRDWFAMVVAIGQQSDCEPRALLQRLRERCEQQQQQHVQVDAVAARARRQAAALGVAPLLLLGLLLLVWPAPPYGAGAMRADGGGEGWFWLVWLSLAALQTAGFVLLARRLRRLRWTGSC